MPAYVLAQGNVQDREKLNEYLAAAPATLAGVDVKVLVHSESPEVIEGEVTNNRHVLMEFPDAAAAKAWYDSAGYEAIRGLRIEASPGTLVILEGLG